VVAALVEEATSVYWTGATSSSLPTLSAHLRFTRCAGRTDEQKASGEPGSHSVNIEECQQSALTDTSKTQEMLEQGVALCTLRKTIQKAVEANGGPVSCMVVQAESSD
jgi:hypothetical protein